MPALPEETKYDPSFVKSHSLQPRWYKFLEAFILVGFLVGYGFLFGWVRAVVFLVSFLTLSLLVHLLYRAKTNRWTESWLDFAVVEEGDARRARSIGKFYYSAIVLNTLVSVVVSQVAR